MNIFDKEFNFFCGGGEYFYYKLTRNPNLTKNFFFFFFDGGWRGKGRGSVSVRA